MSYSQHTIEQQFLEVTFKDRREGMGLQDQLATIYKEKVLPLLESVLNDHDVRDYTIQIDEITIDAGVLTAKNWEQELVERSVQQFKNILQKKLLSPWPKRETAFTTAASMPVKDTIEGVQWLPEVLFHYNRLVQFVTSGSMPANNNQQILQDTIVILLNNKATWQTAANREVLFRLLLTNRQALERLIRQCSGIVEELMDWLYGSPVSAEVIYKKLSIIDDHYTRQSLIYSLLLIRKARQQHMAISNMIAPLELVRTAIYDNSNISIHSIIEELDIPVQNIPTAGREIQAEPIQQQQETTQQASVFHIYNAGLIILHPFLAPFFSKTGLLNDKQEWISPAAQQRAVLLSQYLVTGEEKIPEFLLPLNKLLCGYPLADTLDDQLIVTPAEQKEAEQLLASVIEYWSALKRTSVEALRGSFFQRAGKLMHTEKGWHLQAEQKTFDILMQSIPWTIGRIKTPWMQEWLLTDWI